jgi:hypothetical protein
MLLKFLNSEFFDWYDFEEGREFVSLKNDDNFHTPDWDTIIFYIRRNLLIFGGRTRLLGPITIVFFLLFLLMAWWWGPYMCVSSSWHPLLWVVGVIGLFVSAVTHYDWSEGDVNSRAYWVFFHRIVCFLLIYNFLLIFVSIWALYLGHDGNMVIISYRKIEILTVEVYIRCIDMVMYYKDLNTDLGFFKNKLLFIEQNFETLPFSEQTWFKVRQYHRRSIFNFLTFRINQITEAHRAKLVEDFLKLLWYQETRLLRYQNIPFTMSAPHAHRTSYYERYEKKPAAYVFLGEFNTFWRLFFRKLSI